MTDSTLLKAAHALRVRAAATRGDLAKAYERVSQDVFMDRVPMLDDVSLVALDLALMTVPKTVQGHGRRLRTRTSRPPSGLK